MSNLLERFNAEIKEDEALRVVETKAKRVKTISDIRIIENYRINQDISKDAMIKLLAISLQDYNKCLKGEKLLSNDVWDNYLCLYMTDIGANGRSISSYEKKGDSKRRYKAGANYSNRGVLNA